jgi:hypothetical protein
LGEGEYFFEPNITHGKEMNNLIRKVLRFLTYISAASHFSYKSGTSSLKRLISLVVNAGTLRLREKMMVKKKRKIEEMNSLHNPKLVGAP